MEIIKSFLLNSIDDEHIKQCIQLHETIKKLYDSINKTLESGDHNIKEQLIDQIEKTKVLLDCIIEY